MCIQIAQADIGEIFYRCVKGAFRHSLYLGVKQGYQRLHKKRTKNEKRLS